MKDDSVILSRTVVSAIAALLGEVTAMTDGVLSPMVGTTLCGHYCTNPNS